MGVDRGGGGHCFGYVSPSNGMHSTERKAHPTIWLIEVESSPWWILLLEFYNVIFEKSQSIQESSRWRWD